MQRTPAIATAKWDTAVELSHVTKYFDRVKPISLFKREHERVMALNDVSFRIERGEFVAYAGPNGAGKSTTFKLLSGMMLPQSGSVQALGMNPGETRIPIMRRTGILFGNRSELWWDHPVRASFEWKKAVWSIPEDTYQRMLSEVTQLLGIDEFMDTFARELSLGQRMRANLGMMLLHDPDLILLDEPTLGLDVLAKRMMIDFLKRINKEQGTTILVTSHDMDDLTEMASRLMLINKGEIAFDGDHSQLLERTGDRRTLRITTGKMAPELPGCTLLGSEQNAHTYEYDAAHTDTSALMRALSTVQGIADIETGHAPIEAVIADLYRSWQ